MYWMITNRKLKNGEPTGDEGPLSYFASTGAAPLDQISSWQKLSFPEFRKQLSAEADAFPLYEDPEDHTAQRHVGVFVHGFNNTWQDAARRYRSVSDTLYGGPDRLGTCVLFTWPSDGTKLGYIPDRADARRSAEELASVLSELYSWAIFKQQQGAANPAKACRAKLSAIGHSMGAYVLQKALQVVWTRNNQPLLVSLINQLLLVAADVDNDLFKSGEVVDKSDGDAMANLCYRITALYTGRDLTLGMSAGFKHFGERRLGRSGLARNDAGVPMAPSNVWDLDCSRLIEPGLGRVHSALFEAGESKGPELMTRVLRGDDRKLIVSWAEDNQYPKP